MTTQSYCSLFACTMALLIGLAHQTHALEPSTKGMWEQVPDESECSGLRFSLQIGRQFSSPDLVEGSVNFKGKSYEVKGRVVGEQISIKFGPLDGITSLIGSRNKYNMLQFLARPNLACTDQIELKRVG
jgi:hypothetical protein